MNYIIKTISGEMIEINQRQRDKLVLILLEGTENRAAFVEIGESGPLIATSSIATITEKKTW